MLGEDHRESSLVSNCYSIVTLIISLIFILFMYT